MNCLALERGDDIVVIDCGVMFPGEDVGIDVIHPDLEYLTTRADQVRGVILTHGHEDHIGGVPFLLRVLNVPIYGPPYALALVKERLKQFPWAGGGKSSLTATFPGQPFELGAFRINPIRVTHSMADAHALALETPEHLVIHSGDFRIDPDPVDGQQMELARLADYGQRGVDLLLSDSTNVESSGRCGSEQSVAHTVETAARETTGTVFVAIFSSNTPRLQLLLDVAERLDRKVLPLGRSVITHMRLAEQLGHVRIPPNRIISLEQATSLHRDKLMVILTGTQGEHRSALGRLAAGRLRGLTAEPGDLVLISGRFIPGNDLDIFRLVSALSRRGARVLHSRAEPGVHVSGHAHRDEQRELIELLCPRSFVPIHGAFHHLASHAQLARELGVEQVEVTEDGEPLELSANGLRRLAPVNVGRVHVDGSMGVSELVLRDRRNLRNGVALAVLALDLERGELVVPPQIIARGVGDERNFPALWERASAAVQEAVQLSPLKVRRDPSQLRDTTSRALKRFLSRTIDRRPISLAVVVELSMEASAEGMESGEPEIP
jgi:ribonuclease J